MGLHSLAMDVTKDLKSKKEELLGYFRYRLSEDQLDVLFSDLYLKNVGREGEKKVKKISVQQVAVSF